MIRKNRAPSLTTLQNELGECAARRPADAQSLPPPVYWREDVAALEIGCVKTPFQGQDSLGSSDDTSGGAILVRRVDFALPSA